MSAAGLVGVGARPGRPRLGLGAAVVLVPALVVVVALTAVVGAGRGTALLASLSRALLDVASVGTVGALLAAAWLVPAGHPRTTARLLRAASRWAALAVAAAIVSFASATAQTIGVPVSQLAAVPSRATTGFDLPQGRALVVLALAAAAVWAWAGLVRSRAGARVLTVGFLASMAPLLASGHAATSSSHLLSAEALIVHVLAATVWVGGLLAVGVHLRGSVRLLPSATRSFSRVAGWCFAVVAVSGAAGAWTRLGTDLAAWRSTYGALLLVKTASLVVLGLVGAWHRRRTIQRLEQGRPAAFLRLAGVELALMSGVVGLAVLLSRAPTPSRATVRAVPPHASGYATVDGNLPRPGVGQLLWHLPPDALVLSATLAGLAGVVVWLRAVSGPGWTVSRRLATYTALLLGAWAIAGGLGSYATGLLSAQVAQLLVLGFVVPMLLAVGLPGPALARLADHARHRRQLDATLLLVVLVTVTFETPLLSMSLRTVVGHVGLCLAYLVVGSAAVLPALRRGTGLLLPAAALAYLAWHVADTGRVYAGGWFQKLDWWWGNPVADQQVAAVVLAVTAGLVGVVSVTRQLSVRRKA